MNYELGYTESATATLNALDEGERQTMLKAFEVLREDPYHPASQPMHVSDPDVREVSPTANSLAVYRIIDGHWAVILVLRINHDSLI